MKFYLSSVLFLGLLLAAPIAVSQVPVIQSIPGVRSERMWLPPSREYLRQHLEMAVRKSMEHSECMEVMYARLNEFRTQQSEPTFTVLCRKDHRSTFNLVFKISALDAAYRAPGRESGERNSETEEEEETISGNALDNLSELRELLQREDLLSAKAPEAEAEPEPAPRSRPEVRSQPPRSAEDLLELDEMLRSPATQKRESAPDLF